MHHHREKGRRFLNYQSRFVTRPREARRVRPASAGSRKSRPRPRLHHTEKSRLRITGGRGCAEPPHWFVAACRHGVEGERVVLYTARQASPFKARASSAHSKKHRQITGGRGCAEPPPFAGEDGVILRRGDFRFLICDF